MAIIQPIEHKTIPFNENLLKKSKFLLEQEVIHLDHGSRPQILSGFPQLPWNLENLEFC